MTESDCWFLSLSARNYSAETATWCLVHRLTHQYPASSQSASGDNPRHFMWTRSLISLLFARWSSVQQKSTDIYIAKSAVSVIARPVRHAVRGVFVRPSVCLSVFSATELTETAGHDVSKSDVRVKRADLAGERSRELAQSTVNNRPINRRF